MNTDEIRAQIEEYNAARGVKKSCILDGTRTGIKAHAVENISHLLFEADGLRADLAAMTAERDALNSQLSYACAVKAAFDERWRVENAKYNKAVVHLQRARGQRDTLNVELERMQKEVDKLPTYEAANAGLHDKLCAAAAERDAFKARAEAAERDVTCLISRSPYGLCKPYCKNNRPGCAGHAGCKPEWRGPTATASSTPPQPSQPTQPTQPPPQAAQTPERDA
ncbi:MAG: hypothetical protein ABFC56_09790 [Clostridiaceae bacterium]